MNPVFIRISLGVGAYLLGAVPFGYLVAHFRGIDIRRVGSGNIGATNVFRCVGKPWGIATLLLDVLKGACPVLCFPPLAQCLTQTSGGEAWAVGYGIAAVVGHNWPIYLKFRGGKGVATSAGALVGVAPAAVGIGVAVWVIAFVTGRYVSVASMLAAVSIAAASWARCDRETLLVPAALSLLALLIVWRHRTNIGRLLNGTEHRFQFRKKGADDDANAGDR